MKIKYDLNHLLGCVGILLLTGCVSTPASTTTNGNIKNTPTTNELTDALNDALNNQQSQQFLLSNTTKTWLKSVLSAQDYTNFYANLVNFSTPALLNTGSHYYEARHDAVGTASAIVVSPDGFFYLAYTQPNTTKMTYITNDIQCQSEVHDAIKVFSHVYQKSPSFRLAKSTQEKLIPHECSEVYGHKFPANYSPRSVYRLANFEE